MPRLLAVSLLAGCASTVASDDPCACVIVADPNGALSVAYGGLALQLDGDDGGAYDTVPATGLLTETASGQGIVTRGVGVDAVAGLGMSAEWDPGSGWDTDRPAALVSLFYMPGLRADMDYGTDAFELGPQGGTLTLREVVAREDGGWRVRGAYVAEVCPEAGSTPCATLSGNFAFTADTLPDR